MGINKENYVDQAEQVIKNLMTDRKGNITLTTSKIRNILAMVSEIYNEVDHEIRRSFILRESGTNSIFEIADCV